MVDGDTGAGAADAELTLVGSADNDTMNATAAGSTLLGKNGDDVLNGENGRDKLDGGAGNDTLTGGKGNDIYLFGRGYDSDTLFDTGGNDVLYFGEDINPDQLWFHRQGNNLEVSLIGTSDKITISGWYNGDAYHVEQMQTSSGQTLAHTQIDALVSAMAAFAPPAAGQTSLMQEQQTALAPVIAANWQ